MCTVFINLIGVPSHLHWDAVLKAIINFFSITLEDLLIKILPGENANIILVITRDDVSHDTTIGKVFEEHPELLVAKKFDKDILGRRASKTCEEEYTNEQKLNMLLQIFYGTYPSEDFPALHNGEFYWVFLMEANGITVTVTDIAKEWRRLYYLVYKPSP